MRAYGKNKLTVVGKIKTKLKWKNNAIKTDIYAIETENGSNLMSYYTAVDLGILSLNLKQLIEENKN